MSHFSVLVVADDENDLEKKLQPYHEFECTGIDDEHVVDVDITEKVLSVMHAKSNESEYPEYATEYALDYYGLSEKTVMHEGEINTDDDHKYGYAILADDGHIIKCVDRTNPNAKWDWWQLGGRWTGHLPLKYPFGRESAYSGAPGLFTEKNHDPGLADSALVGDVDWDGIIEKERSRLSDLYDKFHFVWVECIASRDEAEAYQKWCDRNSDVPKFFFGANHYASISRAMSKIGYWNWTIGDAKGFVEKTKDEFLENATEAPVYAFVDERGEWNQRGEMGWFGIDDPDMATDNYDESFWDMIKRLPETQRVFVVDCHI